MADRAQFPFRRFFLALLARGMRERQALRRELRRTRLRLAQTERIAQLGTWECDQEGRARWSEQVARIFETRPGVPLASLDAFQEVIHPDDRAKVAAMRGVAAKGHGAAAFDYRLLFPDGRIKDIRERCESWPEHAVASRSILATFQDITALKVAEAMLENEKSRLRAFIDAIPDLVWIKDTDGVFLACNPVFESFFGAREAVIVGKNDFDFVDAGMAEQFRRRDRDAIAAGKPSVNEEWVTFASDGRRVLLETIKTPFRDDQGRVAGVLGVARDVTDRKRMADALYLREQQFRAIAENSPDVIARYDREGRYLYANPALLQLAGLPAHALLGRTPLDVAAGRRAFVTLQEKLREALETGRKTEVELIEAPAPGIPRPICEQILFTPEFGSEGEVVSVLAIGRDIGRLKAAEQHLVRSRDLLQNLAARQDSEREQERKRIAWEVHEELGQTLMALRINMQLLEQRVGADAGSLHAHLAAPLEMLERAIRVVREVATALRPSVLDLGIDSALEWLAEKFSDANGTPVELKVEPPDLSIDDQYATAIFRIAQEALGNVAQHAQASSVHILLTRQDGDVVLEVRDNGKGFDPDTPKEQSLGLLGIQQRVQRFGGSLAVLSAPGAGTVITVRMPILQTARQIRSL